MAQRKVHLQGGRVSGPGREAGPREEALGQTVVAQVLVQTRLAATRDTALAPEPADQTDLLERSEMGKGRGGSDPEPLGDRIERDPSLAGRVPGDEPEGLELTARKAL